MDTADQIWNRAALGTGGAAPLLGDRALISMLLAHGLVMNGGVHHAVDVLSTNELAAAAKGFTYFGLGEIGQLLFSISADTSMAAWTDENESEANGIYSHLVPSDSHLEERFRQALVQDPDDFSPV